MRIRVTYVATIPDQELIDNDVNTDDIQAVMDYFYENGAEESFHDYGENFEILA